MKRKHKNRNKSRIKMDKEEIIIHEVEDYKLRDVVQSASFCGLAWTVFVGSIGFLFGERTNILSLFTGERIAQADLLAISFIFGLVVATGTYVFWARSKTKNFLQEIDNRELKPLKDT